MKRNNLKSKRNIKNSHFASGKTFAAGRTAAGTRWKNLFWTGLLSASVTLGTLNWNAVNSPAGEIPSPWSGSDPFVVTEDFELNNDVVGADLDTVLKITGNDYVFTNSATISEMKSLDTTEVKKFVNKGTISDLTDQLTARELENCPDGMITFLGENADQTVLSVTNDLVNDGTISSLLGKITIGGTFTNRETGVLESVEGNIEITGDLVNSGEITNSQGEENQLHAANISNTGKIHQIERITVQGRLDNTNGTLEDIDQITVGTGILNNQGSISNVRKVIGDTVNNGTIALADDQNMMTFQGDLTNENGQLSVGIAAGASAPKAGIDNDLYQIVNDGSGNNKAVVSGGSVLVKIRESNEEKSLVHESGAKYTFLTSENGLDVLNGGFAVDAGSDRFKLFNWALGYDDHSYWLYLDRAYKYGQGAPTWNTEQFGKYLDKTGNEAVYGSDWENVLEALDSLNPQEGVVSGEAYRAMAQMDGAIYGSLKTMSVWNQTLVNQQLGNMLRPMCVLCNECEMTANAVKYWGKYFGSTGGTDSDGNAAGFDYSLSGVMTGFDFELGGAARLGGYFAYLDSDLAVQGLNEKADLSNYLFGVYLLKQSEQGYWLANANFGYDKYNVNRHLSFGSGTATIDRIHNSRTDGHQSGIRLERGFNYMTSHALYQPFINVQYIHADTDTIQEDGSESTALRVEAGDYNSLRSEMGMRFLINNNLLSNENVNSRLMFQGAWLHEFQDRYDTIRATTNNHDLSNYKTTAQYAVRGTDSGSDWGDLGLGLDWSRGYLVFHGGYDFLFNERQNLSTGNAGISYGW